MKANMFRNMGAAVLGALIVSSSAHAGLFVGTAYCTGAEVADCALAGGELYDANGSCGCRTPQAPGPTTLDERQVVSLPNNYPWYTAAKVDIGPAGGGRGSAILISDCTMLTAGHAVYAPGSATWLIINQVHPGHYYSEALGSGIDPYGSRSSVGTATNGKWSANMGSDYDYGAIFTSSSFRSAGITTFIPLAFEDSPDFINSAGYPSTGVPSTAVGATQEQWHAFGSVDDYDSRRMYYNATSTGGASGAGVWSYYGSTGERYLVGINTGHDTTWPGKGTRLVSQNQNVITGWLLRSCPGGPLPALSWPSLRSNLRALDGTTIVLKSADALNLLTPPATPVGTPARTLVQVIEGTTYKWQEYHPQGGSDGDDGELAGNNNPGFGGRPPARFIKMLAPQAKVLSTQEARILLSASLLWQRRPARKGALTLSNGSASAIPIVQGNVSQVTDPILAAQNDQSVSHSQ